MNSNRQDSDCRIAGLKKKQGWDIIVGNGWNGYVRSESFEQEEINWDNDRWTETKKKTKGKTKKILED